MGIIYKMSKAMYDQLKYSNHYNTKRASKKREKALNSKEILELINKTFGLKEKVTRIEYK